MKYNRAAVAGFAATALLFASACGRSGQDLPAPPAVRVETSQAGAEPTSNLSEPAPEFRWQSDQTLPSTLERPLQDVIEEVVEVYHKDFWPAFLDDMDVDRELLDLYLSGAVLAQVRGHYVHYLRGEGQLRYSLEEIVELAENRAVVQVCQLEDIDYFNAQGLHSPAKTEPALRQMVLLRSAADGRWRLDYFTNVIHPDDGRFLAECAL